MPYVMFESWLGSENTHKTSCIHYNKMPYVRFESWSDFYQIMALQILINFTNTYLM